MSDLEPTDRKATGSAASVALQEPSSNRGIAMRNVLSGMLFVGVAAMLLFFLIPYGVDAPRKVKFVALHPAYYPRLVTYCLMILGVLVLIAGMRRLWTDGSAKQTKVVDQSGLVTDDANTNSATQFYMLLPIACVCAAVFFALPHLGFPLTTGIALMVLMPLAGEKRWWLVTLIAILLPMLLYLFFTKVANIPIPGGLIDPWLLKI